MAYFKIGTTDFSSYVAELKVGYEVLLSEQSGRNANGDTVVDIVNRKVKIYVKTKALTADEMSNFLTAINPFVVTVSYLDPKTKSLTNKTCYIGTPEPDYYRIINNKTLFKSLSLNFIEM